MISRSHGNVSLVSWMTSQMALLGQFGRPGHFFRHFGVANISKVKNAGKCHDLHRKFKFLILEWVGLFV